MLWKDFMSLVYDEGYPHLLLTRLDHGAGTIERRVEWGLYSLRKAWYI